MKGKILIVDDQFGIRILLNEVLHKEGYTIFQAANGPQAIEIVKKHNPDLVLLDMRLPGMNGPEIFRKMKEINDQIRVIIMTAYGEHEMIDVTKELGVLHHFIKPFDIEEVRDTVKKYMLVVQETNK